MPAACVAGAALIVASSYSLQRQAYPIIKRKRLNPDIVIEKKLIGNRKNAEALNAKALSKIGQAFAGCSGHSDIRFADS